MNTALAVGTALASAAVALKVVAERMKCSSLFFPDRYPAGLWDFSHLAVRPSEHVIRTPDSVRLHALSFRATDPAATMIWFHGNAGNLSTRAEVAANLAAHGISVFLFDYRGYGRSDGTPTERGLMTDSIAAYEYVVQNLEDDPRSIALYGESLGGSYAAYVAMHKPARCVVIENSFPSLRAMAAYHYPHAPFGLAVRKSLTTVDWLNRAGIPVLVMHGTADDVVPFSLGMQLFDSLDVKKQLLRSEGSTHSEIPWREGERYYQTVLSFIKSAGE